MGPPGTPQRAARGFADGKADYLTGLRKIEGQVRGLQKMMQKMIENDTWCPDVVTQVGSVTRAPALLPARAWLARDPSSFNCICSSWSVQQDAGQGPEGDEDWFGDLAPKQQA